MFSNTHASVLLMCVCVVCVCVSVCVCVCVCVCACTHVYKCSWYSAGDPPMFSSEHQSIQLFNSCTVDGHLERFADK